MKFSTEAEIKDGGEHIDIDWYRVPIDRQVLQQLNRRCDLKGLVQSVGFLALLALTGSLVLYSAGRGIWSLFLVPVLLVVHGAFYHFLLNGFHELCHGTVFASRWLNDIFLRIYSLLGWYNYVGFQQSHRRHHRYTLHPPYDSEVVLPIKHSLKGFCKTAIIHFRFWVYIRVFIRNARGIIRDPWLQKLLPESNPALRRQFVRFARLTLLFHGVILVASIVLGILVHPRWFLLPFVTTFARAFGLGLNFVLNETQHVGLSDNVSDFRLCTRSIRVNPFFGFLYWQMQYHIEHHMYAAIPFYNLARLNRLIKDQLPVPPDGVVATWRLIGGILAKQKTDPAYTYKPAIPPAR